MLKEAKQSSGMVLLPTQSEVDSAFKVLASTADSGRKYCFIIDGLDEYEGDKHDAVAIIQSVASAPHVKVLLSSQPLNLFVNAFSPSPTLSLQDLTRPDIEIYVR
jgi:hypothetical protein